jgi:hypothetical protein
VCSPAPSAAEQTEGAGAVAPAWSVPTMRGYTDHAGTKFSAACQALAGSNLTPRQGFEGI